MNIPQDGAGGQAYGAYYVTHSQDPATATRDTARKAYYDPAAGRPNLHLLTGNRVTRLITDASRGDPNVAAVEVSMGLTKPANLLLTPVPLVRALLGLGAHYRVR